MFFIHRLLLSLLITSFCWAAESQKQLLITSDRDDYNERIAQTFPEPFAIESVTFNADVFLEDKEFFYLTDLQAGMLITPAVLSKAVSYLFKKNKFESVMLSVEQGERGKKLHVELVGFWTFHALKIHGIVLGKDTYRQYYLLEPGDRFDEHKHQLSVERLKEVFTERGYCANEVTTRQERTSITKSITVHSTLQPGDRFSIGHCTLVTHEIDAIDPDDLDELKKELHEKFFKRIGKSNYSKELLNRETRAIKRFLAKKGFLHVPIVLHEQINSAHCEVDLTFILELHKKKRFIFSGNQFFSDDQLLDTLLMFGQSVWLLPLTIIQQELEQVYRKKGFWKAEISAEEDGDSNCCRIKEGPRVVIKKISLQHLSGFDPEMLKKKFFADLLKRKDFDDDLIAKAVDDLVSWYVGQGYLEAKISKQEFVPYGDQEGDYELILTLDEGPLYVLKSVTIDDDQYKHLEEQGPLLAFKKAGQPKPFTTDIVQEQRGWLLRQLQYDGYRRINVVPEIERDGNQVHLVWKIINPEKKGTFGKTILMGSSTFPFDKMMRELYYKEGDRWDQHTIKESMARLKDLEIFEHLYLYPYDVTRQGSVQDMILKTQMDDRFEFRMRGGFAVQQINKQLLTAGLTYRIGGAFYVKNPFNVGDQFFIEGDFDRSQRTFLVQYQQPWLFTMPIKTIIQGYDNAFRYPGLIGSKKNLYQVTQQGFLVGLLRKCDHTDHSLNVGIELMETTIRNADPGASQLFAVRLARAINFEPDLLNVKVPYVVVEPTLLIDYVDQRLQPTRGVFTLLTLKGMFPFGPDGQKSFFVRLFGEQSFFIPINLAVLALRIRAGHIFYRKLNNIMPPERFYLGGANSIRSYETDRCPPLGRFDENGCVQLVPQGGKSMANINAEIRFPLFRRISGVIFQDLGVLSGENIFTASLRQDLLAGTGFGIRYNTPIGPLRADIAWKWKKSDPHEARYAWFIALGNAF